jgi:hypothetical protein
MDPPLPRLSSGGTTPAGSIEIAAIVRLGPHALRAARVVYNVRHGFVPTDASARHRGEQFAEHVGRVMSSPCSLVTSPDGAWAAARLGRRVLLFSTGIGDDADAVSRAPGELDSGNRTTAADPRGPVLARRLELDDEDAELALVGPPNVLVIVSAHGRGARVALHPPPQLDRAATLELEQPMRIAAITGPRVALAGTANRRVVIMRAAGRALSSMTLELAGPLEFAVGLERNQLLLGLPRGLEVWDAAACRPLLRPRLALPPPPRRVGSAAGHLWAIRPGSDELLIYRLSDGRPSQHHVGAPILDVISHAASPLLVVVTSRGLSRVQCFAQSLMSLEGAPPALAYAQLVHREDVCLLGLTTDDTLWRVPLVGNTPVVLPATSAAARNGSVVDSPAAVIPQMVAASAATAPSPVVAASSVTSPSVAASPVVHASGARSPSVAPPPVVAAPAAVAAAPATAAPHVAAPPVVAAPAAVPRPLAATSPVGRLDVVAASDAPPAPTARAAPAWGSVAVAEEIYQLRLALVHTRAVQAAAARAPNLTPEAVARFSDEVAPIRSRLAVVEERGPMMQLARGLALTDAQVELVWTVVACTADPRIGVHMHALVGGDARQGLSLSAYSTVFGGVDHALVDLARELTPAHPLFRYGLLERGRGDASPIFAPITASQSLVAFLSGRASSAPFVEPLVIRRRLYHDANQRLALDRLRRVLQSPEPAVLVLEGPRGSGRRTALAHVARELGRNVVSIDLRRMSPDPGVLQDALATLRGQALLAGALPLIADLAELGEGERAAEAFRVLGRFFSGSDQIVAVTSTVAGLDLLASLPTIRVSWQNPDVATQLQLWQVALGEHASSVAAELERVSIRYRLGPGDIERAADSAHVLHGSRDDGTPFGHRDLVEGIRSNIAEQLGGLADRVEVKQTWDDLVLAPDILDQIHALVARVRHAHEVYERWSFHRKVARGIGVPALFSGPPGTGKTMVAGLIAKELDLELYQVDLSKVVSKWVGETEKQLARVFDAAEAGHALLLFDEADSLFARRTEVRGSNDRYANLEVNYLLQRIEAFGGITILTTNLEASIDPALKRRLAAHVVFWTPDEDERAKLWRRTLDTGSAPLAADLDYDELARSFPEMSGAHIRNAVLAAAFLAAAEQSGITQEHLLRAARGEYRSMGRVLR